MTRTDINETQGPVNIGGAAKASGVSAKMIRYYESIGLLPPSPRTEGNYRMYDARAVHVLRFIHRSRSLGFSLEEIRTLLSLWNDRERASADVKAVTLRHVADLDARISELQSMRDTLMTLANACHGDDRPDCPILESVAGEGGVPDRRQAGLHPGAIRLAHDEFPERPPGDGGTRVVRRNAQRVEHHRGVGHGGVDAAEPVLAVEPLGHEGDGPADGAPAEGARKQLLQRPQHLVDGAEARPPARAVGAANPVAHMFRRRHEQLLHADAARVARANETENTRQRIHDMQQQEI